jgi:hypothetical protein
MKLLKKVLLGENTIFTLFYVNAREEHKEESKQLLAFSQQ